ncbi:CotH kinase family protein [Stigmatella sp. ncwal1]|uniref:CotH kinase family protein n=1 Tax=Stigmatella ashevillensis TaxID=2995309 RepID=A0ABT5D661_9BACT|nr:CotH kinase family protein [Stigmatella ashevillena]MDC0709159.1 CotH kinase family protein [Stigmatella ashevillena]
MKTAAVSVAGDGQDGREQGGMIFWIALVGTVLLTALSTGCGHDEAVEEPAPDPKSGVFTFPALQTDVPLYELTIPLETLAKFEANPYEDEHPATFVFEGKTYSVGVRLRGSSSRFFPKKSWRIEFPKDTAFDGRRKHNLVAEFQDRTMMAEKLAYDSMLAMGLPAPVTKYVRLSINGQYQGVFLDIERVDNSFAEAHGFEDPDPTIYRCGAKDCEMKLWRTAYQQDWQKETNEEKEPGKDDIRTLMNVINRAPEPDFAWMLGENIELERYLRTMAAEVLISNNISEDSQSYFIHDRVTHKWTYVAWDLNNADARWWPTYGLGMKPVVDHPLFPFSLADQWVEKMYLKRNTRPDFLPTFSNLNTRILYNPELRERLFAVVEKSLTELFDPAVIEPRLDAMHQLIAPHMAADPYLRLNDMGQPDPDGLAKFHEGLPFLKAYAQQRTAFVRRELERFRTAPATSFRLNAVRPSEGWVELHNPTAQTLSTAGLVLSADLRRTIPALRQPGTSTVLPERRVPPQGTVRFTREELGFTLPLDGELGLFDGVSVVGAKDVLFYTALPSGGTYVRGDDSRWEAR